ncbi:Ubiquinone biosynthesis O-methyltransferase [Streptomyces hundungensis]|uniref:Ubiquinone biosynthesis O-methyltransferase n=1 Tax=Streptomyces hundungensis TaxID=1077946 RepID=A0A387H443_9ACTN|nr:class I SAM-dependent methyltransferase [Streptomyces hundungensis]AYG77939.1 Ubiquinone biosynthesis O-methyltransferase [Streptomyces hundungensis]
MDEDTPYASEEAAWDAYATRDRNQIWARGPERFHFTQWTLFPAHGPGVELIPCGPGTSVLDLGFGACANLAHLASLGGRAVGVDVSRAQVDAARAAHGDRLELHHDTAERFLTRCREEFDAVVSVFGGVWFCDPEVLLPLIWDRLKPGGVLVFSHRPPEDGEHGRTPHTDVLPAHRWSYAPGEWLDFLEAAGFTEEEAWTVPPPPTKEGLSGTVIVRGRRPS